MTSVALAGPEAVKHPVYPVKEKASAYEQRVAVLMKMPEEAMVALVPEMNGFSFCDCPNCEGGREESQIVWNGPQDPNHVRCRYCGMVFPNDKYPMSESLVATNRRGEKETWRYHKDTNGNECYFLGRARYAAKAHMGRRAYDLAAAYHLTRKRVYARRAALLLHRYSQVYPKWNVMYDYPAPGKKYPISNAKPPYPYWGGIWSRWWYGDIPIDLIKAYDLIHDSGELEKLSRQTGTDVRKQIEDGVFRAAVAFVRSYKDTASNMSPRAYVGVIVAGHVLGEPDYVHDAVERVLKMYRTQFFFDGMWHEGTTCYHYQTTGGLSRCLDAAKGYSDPPGYRWPADGSRYDKLDLARRVPIIARARTAPLLLMFPNKRAVAVHDTWPTRRGSAKFAEGPALLADMGHGRLGCGKGDQMMQTHLHFSGGFGHQHGDNLGLILFAKGRELLSDIGYTWTAWRFWVSCTQSHNTVAVDGKSHATRGHGGDLTLYSAVPGPVQAIEAVQPGSYPGVTDEFRRRLVQVQTSPANAYVLDVFRVRGGTRHEWLLHGSSWHPQTAELSLPVKATPGTLLGPRAKFTLPFSNTVRGEAPKGKSLAYAMFRNLREATTDDTFQATWRFQGDIKARLRTTVLGQSGCRVVLAHTPQIRPAKENDGDLPKHWRPSLVVQRSGDAKLASTFVAVHEPFLRAPFIKSITSLLPPDKGQPGNVVALAIEHRAGTDYIVSCPQPQPVAVDLPEGRRLKCTARLAVMRVKAGEVVLAYLCDGEELSLGRFALKCPPSHTGTIERVHRDEGKGEYSFLVTGQLPVGDALAGHTILITHPDKTTHGYLIRSVEPQGGRSLVRLQDDPGFDVLDTNTRFLFYPPHEVKGGNTYRVNSVVVMNRRVNDGR